MNNSNIVIGSFVLSLAGRDKGRIHIVTGCDSKYVYIVDGITRKVENPKKKISKHVFVLDYPIYCDEFSNKSIKNKIQQLMTM